MRHVIGGIIHILSLFQNNCHIGEIDFITIVVYVDDVNLIDTSKELANAN